MEKTPEELRRDERAAELAPRAGGAPAYIAAAAQGFAADQFTMTSYYRDNIGVPEMGVTGAQLWRQSGLAPADIATAGCFCSACSTSAE